MQSYIAIRLSNAPSMKWGPDLPLILSCKMRANGSQFFPNWDMEEGCMSGSKIMGANSSDLWYSLLK